MKKEIRKIRRSTFIPIDTYEGQTIEKKIQAMIENNEPIGDTTGLHFTEKKDGVRAEYNIRTDKWEIAQSTMDKVNKAKIAKGNMTQGNNDGDETPSEQS